MPNDRTPAESPLPTVERLPAAVVVHVLARELRKTEVDDICAAVDDARVADPTLPYIFDMAKVTFAGSMGIGVLVGLNQEFRTREQRLIFANLQPFVRQAFDVTRISQLMEIAPDVPTALRTLAAG